MKVVRYLVTGFICFGVASTAVANEMDATLPNKVSTQSQTADNAQAKAFYEQAIQYMTDSKNAKANQAKIVDLLTKSAELDYTPAQVDLGKVYYFGLGGNRNDAAALVWFKRAAELGDAKGQYHLGQMYTEGKAGLKESEKEASVWYKKSADQGYAPAQYYLAILYMAGVDGIEKNPTQAIELLQKAAKQGDQEAIQLLSKIQPQQPQSIDAPKLDN
ncbi:hypothetical protein DKL61_02860 [Gammaproteobacteria bacterium ESL0073]|uniref:Sel1 repeat family protein n=1 Tax=Entomomonas moraniae TaxID=2213226 RepID=A0A3S9XF50_9GAMM|nr:tetratricopeptide repeat protein [Entomomonas moraniae]AWM79377.1 hypothetical protein DKL61_02860 [Gammaproteobacteria bacterium ESL0073]AZS51000.1 sel1 repeat family protein [Entomomonas moraniae]